MRPQSRHRPPLPPTTRGLLTIILPLRPPHSDSAAQRMRPQYRQGRVCRIVERGVWGRTWPANRSGRCSWLALGVGSGSRCRRGMGRSLVDGGRRQPLEISKVPSFGMATCSIAEVVLRRPPGPQRAADLGSGTGVKIGHDDATAVKSAGRAGSGDRAPGKSTPNVGDRAGRAAWARKRMCHQYFVLVGEKRKSPRAGAGRCRGRKLLRA